MKILIIGGGSFGTAMAQELASNKQNKIQLLFKKQEEAEAFNSSKINQTYFPNRPLDHGIEGLYQSEKITKAEVIFIAVPAKNIPEVARLIKPYLQSETMVVNLAKGIFENGQTLVE